MQNTLVVICCACHVRVCSNKLLRVNRLINSDILELIVNMLCLTVEIDLDEALSRSLQVTNYLQIVLLW